MEDGLMSNVENRDDAFHEVAKLLYGGGADELVAKLSNAEKDRRKRGFTAGLSAVGAGAGGLGLAVGAKEIHGRAKKLGSLAAGYKATPKLTRALIPVEVAGLGGELMATKILHGDAKKSIKKSEPCAPDTHIMTGGSKQYKIARGAIKRINESPRINQAKVDVGRKAKEKVKSAIGKSFTWEGEFSKVDEDKRQVFGWASIVEMGGEPVYDLQGDFIEMDEIEKSAYDYVIKSRKGGDMHRRNADNTPVHSSDMIESFMVTPEKIAKMNLPEGSLPTGWWVGFQVNDDDAWNLVKSGKRTAFSIHGRGNRTPLEDQ